MASATQLELYSYTILNHKGPVLSYVQDLVAKVTQPQSQYNSMIYL